MIEPEELQRQIVRQLSQRGFTESELLLRRIMTMARHAKNGSQPQLDGLLREAGINISAQELVEILKAKPWLISTIESEIHAPDRQLTPDISDN